jgi:hypothetical protein
MILILVSLITMKSLTVLLVLFVCCQSVKIRKSNLETISEMFLQTVF